MSHACNGLYFENSLWLSAERDCCLEGVLNAMATEELQQIGGILVDNDIGVGDVNAKAVREPFFLFLKLRLASMFVESKENALPS